MYPFAGFLRYGSAAIVRYVLAFTSAFAAYIAVEQLYIYLYVYAAETALFFGAWQLGGESAQYIPAMLVAGLFSLYVRAQRRRLMSASVRANFSGLLANQTVRKLEKKPERLNFRPRERVLTVMFIDIAGFSLSAEDEDPNQLFSHLQKYAGAIQGIVHRYGGSVDKFQGDGVLCYFGYDFMTGNTTDDHAAHAVRCAMAIQRASLGWSQHFARKGRPIYPLRIGINTGAVVIGDMGNGERYNYTIIGHGVNYAKRMEQCCGFFKVMISATTKELIQSLRSSKVAVNKQLVQIKHFDELREAYEVDPLVDRAGQVETAIGAYRRHLGIQRRQERFQITKSEHVEAYTDFGAAQIVDHSFSGLGIKLSRYLASGCEVTLRLDSTQYVGKSLLSYGIQEIVGEVRWAGASSDQSFQHGLVVKNLSHRQLSVLHGVLKRIGDKASLPLAG